MHVETSAIAGGGAPSGAVAAGAKGGMAAVAAESAACTNLIRSCRLFGTTGAETATQALETMPLCSGARAVKGSATCADRRRHTWMRQAGDGGQRYLGTGGQWGGEGERGVRRIWAAGQLGTCSVSHRARIVPGPQRTRGPDHNNHSTTPRLEPAISATHDPPACKERQRAVAGTPRPSAPSECSRRLLVPLCAKQAAPLPPSRAPQPNARPCSAQRSGWRQVRAAPLRAAAAPPAAGATAPETCAAAALACAYAAALTGAAPAPCADGAKTEASAEVLAFWRSAQAVCFDVDSTL